MTPVPDPADAVRVALSYHRRTKHHLHRYAQSPGYLDWANQPDPFRTFAGAEPLPLPLLADAVTASFTDLHAPGAGRPRRLDLNALAILFELALGLSAWKEYRGSRWALRCNPSSGNLHPTEGYALVPAVPGLDAGGYHYVSRDHTLERRCLLDTEAAGHFHAALPAGSFLVGLSSVHWREAWKYGERAFRYCQHDAGHALAAMRYAAACLGWSARLLDHLGDAAVAHCLGLDRDADFAGVDPLDREHPDALMLVGPPDAIRAGLTAVPELAGRWVGQANRLSSHHVHWEVIDHVAAATWKPAAPSQGPLPPPLPPLLLDARMPAARLIRQRRSCLALDGRTSIPAATFYTMLDSVQPRLGVPPFDLLPWTPTIHLAIFVHRVEGLAPGLYLLERNETVHDALRGGCRADFAWETIPGCPEHLRLFRLAGGDFRERARTISCHQEIASDGAFSLGMIAQFGDTIRGRGAWWYRRLFWESGVLGQALYLQAEAAGVRSTGIGCYFDEVMHELLGLKGDRFQSLYHFTVGGPVEDPRLRTIAPYAHLRR
jgi:SagB-type dehydrogenase family enzyme